MQKNEIRAVSKYVRMSPSKIRRVLRQIQGKTYPEALLEDNTNKNTEEVEVTELFESIKKVGIASSPEGGRPVLTGVYFNNKNNAGTEKEGQNSSKTV